MDIVALSFSDLVDSVDIAHEAFGREQLVHIDVVEYLMMSSNHMRKFSQNVFFK